LFARDQRGRFGIDHASTSFDGPHEAEGSADRAGRPSAAGLAAQLLARRYWQRRHGHLDVAAGIDPPDDAQFPPISLARYPIKRFGSTSAASSSADPPSASPDTDRTVAALAVLRSTSTRVH